VVKTPFTTFVYLGRREVGEIAMIALVALLHVSQPLLWLDRNWINHQARREMLVSASASGFDPVPRLRLVLPAQAHAVPRTHALLGGPSGL
jgi:hypothetical protein